MPRTYNHLLPSIEALLLEHIAEEPVDLLPEYGWTTVEYSDQPFAEEQIRAQSIHACSCQSPNPYTGEPMWTLYKPNGPMVSSNGIHIDEECRRWVSLSRRQIQGFLLEQHGIDLRLDTIGRLMYRMTEVYGWERQMLVFGGAYFYRPLG